MCLLFVPVGIAAVIARIMRILKSIVLRQESFFVDTLVNVSSGSRQLKLSWILYQWSK